MDMKKASAKSPVEELESVVRIESALLQDDAVDECAVILRPIADSSTPLPVAYIVTTGPFSPVRLYSRLKDLLPEDLLPVAFIRISHLPFNEDGLLDKQRLSGFAVPDTVVAGKWETLLESQPGIAQAAVVMSERQEELPVLHLSDLLPETAFATSAPGAQTDPANEKSSQTYQREAELPLAIIDGGELSQQENMPATLVAALERAAERSPRYGIVFMEADGSVTELLYSELLSEAGKVQAGLRGLGLNPGDKAIFIFDRNRDFIVAFWGCVLAGVVPAPLSVPVRFDAGDGAIKKLLNTWRMLDNPVILTRSALTGAVRSLKEIFETDELRVEPIETLCCAEPDAHRHRSNPQDLALLMLTSGSTGMPKGVQLNHANILCRSAGAMARHGFSDNDVSLNFFPLDHVVGLVMFHLRDVYLCCRQIHAPISLFLQEPLKWLDWISYYRVTVTWAPNFAYGLVNQCEDTIRQRKWDLSSLATIINGGEAIVPATARRFMELLVPFGLAETAMIPAWGMAETSSGIVFSNDFSLAPSPDDSPCANLGTPIPGISLRIVNEQFQPVRESTVGRLQVKGLTVTSGYYKNLEANRESFSPDGWFDTGDLGYIRNGCLTITGRAKDVIIINGANYSNHEIESEVEAVAGVMKSFAAATAVTVSPNAPEKLAVFFSPQATQESFNRELLKNIRARVVKNVGVNPDFLIPVPPEDIPKTAIGKIQRSQLRKYFESGAVNNLVKKVDCCLENANTLPAWFFQKTWHKKEATPLRENLPGGPFLLFSDRAGLGDALLTGLDAYNFLCISVYKGKESSRETSRSFTLAPNDDAQYHSILDAVSRDGSEVTDIIHCWSFGNTSRNSHEVETLRQCQDSGVLSLINLTKALAARRKEGSDAVRLFIVTDQAAALGPEEPLVFEKTTLAGFVRTLAQECPWLDCRLIDIAPDTAEANSSIILKELRTLNRDREVVFRAGFRWVPSLEAVIPSPADNRLPSLQEKGIYLITGGLGGIGTEIAEFLAVRYRARLLLTGITVLPPENERHTRMEGQDKAAIRLQAFQRLQKTGADLKYLPIDVCDAEEMQQAVTQAESDWQGELSGIFHLAGIRHERPLLEESAESFSAALRPKLMGVAALRPLLEKRPEAFFVSFSTVNSFLGGATSGAFASSSSFLDGFTYFMNFEKKSSGRCFNISWTPWNGIGMSSDFQMMDLARARGYREISARQGIHSLFSALFSGHSRLLIGLDGTNRFIRRFLWNRSVNEQMLTGYFTSKDKALMTPVLDGAQVHDRFGTLTDCRFVQLDEMPFTAAGEKDRDLLAKGIKKGNRQNLSGPTSEAEKQITAIWREVLGQDDIGVQDNFFELGGHSILLAQVHGKLQPLFAKAFSVVQMFKYPTIHALAQFLGEEDDEAIAPREGRQRAEIRKSAGISGSGADIAIIGMACRFPGAENLDAFWHNLREGNESITFFTDEEVLAAGVDPALVADANYVKAGPIIADIDKFDAEFFGITPREAAILDPQHRIFFENAWEALENAGYNPLSYPGSIGVYAAAGMNTYLINNVCAAGAHLEAGNDSSVLTVDSMGGFHTMTTNDKEYLATRLSYRLNLRGPSLNIQTACSSTLVTMHMAAQSLLSGECDIALSGGVSIKIPQTAGYLFQEGMIVSPDGHCRAFDAEAKGTIFGDGVGVVVLKRLRDAIEDRDHIYAVIKGTAINNDGGVKVGFMAPSEDGQASVMTEAINMAGIDAASIGYVEAHGTGTQLGDPIEVGALSQAFRSHTDKKGFCALGSVKTNIGHLQITSGVAGFIKAALALYHEEIPASLHYTRPNPMIDFANSPFYINSRLTEWKRDRLPRRAGVNSLGIGGTNAHVILEEAPAPETARESQERTTHILTLSARSNQALFDLAAKFRTYLNGSPQSCLANICYTANVGRVLFDHRLAVVADSCEQLRDRLAAFEAGRTVSGVQRGTPAKREKRQVCFLFTGQGSQYPGMGRELYETHPVFRQTLDHCAEILQPFLPLPLTELLFQDHPDLLNQTACTQPALFALEYSLAELLRSWSVTPDMVMGHSAGEYVAACVAGVFSLEDGLTLLARRARLMGDLPRQGIMVAVMADEKTVMHTISRAGVRVSVAAVNSPVNVVISGDEAEVYAVVAKLKADDIKTTELPVSHAFHSPLMQPMAGAFAEAATRVIYNAPAIPVISNVSGQRAGEDIASAEYWVRHVLEPVRFQAGIGAIRQAGCDIFIECGPKPVLAEMGRQCAPDDGIAWLPCLRQGGNDWRWLLESLGSLHALGIAVDWQAFDQPYRRRRMPLPTYPFQRQRYWIAPDRNRSPLTKSTASSPPTHIIDLLDRGMTDQLAALLEKNHAFSDSERNVLPALLAALVKEHRQELQTEEIAAHCYEQHWQELPATAAAKLVHDSDDEDFWLLFADRNGLGQALAVTLRQNQHKVFLVFAGNGFARTPDLTWTIDPGTAADYNRLLREVAENCPGRCSRIVHCWSADAPAPGNLNTASLEASQGITCGSVVRLVRSLVGQSWPYPPELWFLTRGAMGVTLADGAPAIAQAPLWGLCKTLALEHVEMWGGIIDLPPDPATVETGTLAGVMIDSGGEDFHAFRNGKRYVPRLQKISPAEPRHEAFKARNDGIYLLTGGLGGLGLRIATWLSEMGAGHLLLTGRSQPSPEALQAVRHMEDNGCRVRIVNADISRTADAEQVFRTIDQSGIPLRGIVHAAGISSFHAIATMEPGVLEEMLRPKMLGAWNLHQLSRQRALDFFLCFSSIASVWGSRQQGHYAAANQFLDTFAAYGRAHGLPVMSVNWGPWAGGGMVTPEVEQWLKQHGVTAIAPDLALNILSSLLQSGRVQTTVAQVDWTLFKPLYEAKARRPFLERMEVQHRFSPAAEQRTGSLLKDLKRMPPEEQRDALTLHIKLEISDLLGMGEAKSIDDQQGFFDLGMDSFMTVELKSRLEKNLGCMLPSTLAFDFPTIATLAAYLFEDKLSATRNHAQTAERQTGRGAEEPGEAALDADHLRALSDEETELMLLDKLKNI